MQNKNKNMHRNRRNLVQSASPNTHKNGQKVKKDCSKFNFKSIKGDRQFPLY